MDIKKLEPTIDLLVKKYNYGKLDEDLKQDAWVCALEAEQKYPKVSEEEFIKIVSVCIQNMFKDKLRKRKLEMVNIPEDFDFESNIDLLLFLTELKDSLTDQEKEVLDLLLLGKTPDEIASEIKTTSRTVYNIMNKIKFKIKE